MTYTDVERLILDLTNDDSYALSEVVSWVHQVLPHQSSADTKTLVRTAVENLVNRGRLIALWMERPDGPEEVLDPERTRTKLGDDLAWLSYKHWRPHIRIAAAPDVSGRE
jgi:hypothetical protein